jgi:hypothetical protein
MRNVGADVPVTAGPRILRRTRLDKICRPVRSTSQGSAEPRPRVCRCRRTTRPRSTGSIQRVHVYDCGSHSRSG